MSDFTKEQSSLQAITGKTAKELEKLKQQALELGGSTEFTAKQVTQLNIELAKLGFTVNEISASTPEILKFASATGADLADAASVAGGALRAFGLDATQMDRVVSTLAISTTKSALQFDDFATVISTVFPIANKFGLEIEEVTAILGKLRDVKFDASRQPQH